MQKLVICLFFTIWSSLAYPNFHSNLQTFQVSYPGAIDSQLKCYVPHDLEVVPREFRELTYSFCCAIGTVTPPENPDSLDWRNSVDTVEELHNLAKKSVPIFKELIQDVVKHVSGSYATFGPNDVAITKTLQSLKEKVERIQVQTKKKETEIVPALGDSLRGTIVTHDTAQLLSAISSLKQMAAKHNFQIAFSNKFSENYASGYVAIHAKLWVSNTSKEKIISEIQIHFYYIMDGTLECPKEDTHKIYEILRKLDVNDKKTDADILLEKKGDVASTLEYLFGLKQVPEPSFGKCPQECGDYTSTEYAVANGLLGRYNPQEDLLETFSEATGEWSFLNPRYETKLRDDIMDDGFEISSEQAEQHLRKKGYPAHIDLERRCPPLLQL